MTKDFYDASWFKYSSSNLAVVFTEAGSITCYNPLFAEHFFTGDASPTKIHECFSHEELKKLTEVFHQLQHDKAHSLPFISNYNDGYAYKWEFTYQPADNNFIGIAHTLDKLSKNESSLIPVDHLIESFMNNSPASAWICDEEGRLLSMNRYYLNFTGLSASDTGKTLWSIFPKELADIYHENNQIVLNTNEVLKTEEESVNVYGEKKNFLVYKFPLQTVNNIRLIGGWSIDITDRKLAEEKIREHNLKLQELAFLQSHQVRRPLANILGLIELIKHDNGSIKEEQMRNLLLYIQQSATELDDEIMKIMDKLQGEDYGSGI